jgi:SAM-dependent methyltransferase
MTFITQNDGQFPYFNRQLGEPSWPGKTVLDFGGNIGNVLHHPSSTIDHDKYWCLDVSRDAIELGRKAAPNANFIFYDRYNPEYNPLGIKTLPLPISETTFDFILALSVFTHTSKAEMVDYVHQLRRLLNRGGRLAFTFLDPHYTPPDSRLCNLSYYCEQRLEPDAKRNSLRREDLTWCTIAGGALTMNNEGALADSAENEYLVFYTPEFIRTIFSDMEVLDPVAPFARQHCCVFTYA